MANTSSMGLDVTGSSMTMGQAVLTIWITKANYCDMMSLVNKFVINGGTVAYFICCLHQQVRVIHQLLPQVGSHHEHLHLYLIHMSPSYIIISPTALFSTTITATKVVT